MYIVLLREKHVAGDREVEDRFVRQRLLHGWGMKRDTDVGDVERDDDPLARWQAGDSVAYELEVSRRHDVLMRVERTSQLGFELQPNISGNRPADVRDHDVDHVALNVEVDDHEWLCLFLAQAPRFAYLPPRDDG